MADNDRIEGTAKNMGGKMKEGVGNVTGDEKLKAEGKAEQVEGKVQNTIGGIKDAINEKH
ncbi:CsbD family protein [Brevundimonas sp. SL161]|uniref:CsbD family protein n=1 Tax=Brevundimonas sp. SL161 TaxID=2804613 RepID=UPI003CF2392B